MDRNNSFCYSVENRLKNECTAATPHDIESLVTTLHQRGSLQLSLIKIAEVLLDTTSNVVLVAVTLLKSF